MEAREGTGLFSLLLLAFSVDRNCCEGYEAICDGYFGEALCDFNPVVVN